MKGISIKGALRKKGLIRIAVLVPNRIISFSEPGRQIQFLSGAVSVFTVTVLGENRFLIPQLLQDACGVRAAYK
jgi:hypothetical protein